MMFSKVSRAVFFLNFSSYWVYLFMAYWSANVWGFSRIMRVAIGGLFISLGVYSYEWVLVGAGALFGIWGLVVPGRSRTECKCRKGEHCN